jgi:hypothetical protein
LDVRKMDELRMDHRVDGLHSCTPSHLMEWCTLFLNLLKRVLS